MDPNQYKVMLTQAVDDLSESESYKGLFHRHVDDTPIPSWTTLHEIVELTRSILFPGYYGPSTIYSHTMKYHIGVEVERLYSLLQQQILAGLCFSIENEGPDTASSLLSAQRQKASEIAAQFISQLPHIRRILATDVEAAYNGDPAAHSFGEVISCYPAIRAISNYRIAHLLLTLGVPLIPRIITEMAHSETGIDIHPGAQIGSYFTIDHGTGVVIGETCIIGERVKLYQGVTLGAKSFAMDDNGNPVKGVHRHPCVGNNVVIYAGATILGGDTCIGDDSTIGGSVWLTHSVPAGSKIYNK